MLTYRTGAANAPSVAGRMADHLMEQTQPRAAADRARYYQRGLEGGPEHEGHTVPEPRRDLAPEVARALGIDPNRGLGRDEVANLLNGLRVDGGDIAGKQKQNKAVEIGYIDLCFSADKSVSLAWAFAPTDAERTMVMQAHRDAVAAVMRHIEGEIAHARRGHAGRDGTVPG